MSASEQKMRSSELGKINVFVLLEQGQTIDEEQARTSFA